MTTRDENASAKLLTDEKWNGSRDPGFRKFLRDLHAGGDAIFLQDDDYSILSSWLDNDQGGNAQGADPMPAQAKSKCSAW